MIPRSPDPAAARGHPGPRRDAARRRAAGRRRVLRGRQGPDRRGARGGRGTPDRGRPARRVQARRGSGPAHRGARAPLGDLRVLALHARRRQARRRLRRGRHRDGDPIQPAPDRARLPLDGRDAPSSSPSRRPPTRTARVSRSPSSRSTRPRAGTQEYLELVGAVARDGHLDALGLVDTFGVLARTRSAATWSRAGRPSASRWKRTSTWTTGSASRTASSRPAPVRR
jgi:hypothetical protein